MPEKITSLKELTSFMEKTGNKIQRYEYKNNLKISAMKKERKKKPKEKHEVELYYKKYWKY